MVLWMKVLTISRGYQFPAGVLNGVAPHQSDQTSQRAFPIRRLTTSIHDVSLETTLMSSFYKSQACRELTFL